MMTERDKKAFVSLVETGDIKIRVNGLWATLAEHQREDEVSREVQGVEWTQDDERAYQEMVANRDDDASDLPEIKAERPSWS